jgi:hypothetical protein
MSFYPRVLPPAQTLGDAVRAVIANPDGNSAAVFARMTQDGNAPNLVAILSRLINDLGNLQILEKELGSFPYLLTIEDYVCRNGSSWGFNQATIAKACVRVERYDQVAGRMRYGTPAEVKALKSKLGALSVRVEKA